MGTLAEGKDKKSLLPSSASLKLSSLRLERLNGGLNS